MFSIGLSNLFKVSHICSHNLSRIFKKKQQCGQQICGEKRGGTCDQTETELVLPRSDGGAFEFRGCDEAFADARRGFHVLEEAGVVSPGQTFGPESVRSEEPMANVSTVELQNRRLRKQRGSKTSLM